MADKEKLKKLEALMQHAGMGTGADVFKNKAFQKVNDMVNPGAGPKPQSKAPQTPSSGPPAGKKMPFKKPLMRKNFAPKPSSPSTPATHIPASQDKKHEKFVYASQLKEEFGKDISYQEDTWDIARKSVIEVIEELKILNHDITRKYVISNDIKSLLTKKLDEEISKLESLVNDSPQSSISETKREIVAKENKIILLIENSITQRTIIRSKLKNAGYKNIEEVKNGQDAFNKILKRYKQENAKRIDLVILDLDLPGLSGREIIKNMKSTQYIDEHPGIDQIPILISSSHKMTKPDGSEMTEEQLHSLNLYYMSKPFKEELFIKQLKTMFPEDFE